MMKTVGVYFTIVVCLFSVSVMADYMQGFVDMEDFASLAADWQDPADIEDLTLLAANWLTFYTPAPSLAWWEMEETSGTVAYDSTTNGYDLVPTDGFVIADAVTGSMVGSGFLFDGTGERLTEPDLLDDFPDAITITGWLRPDATGMSKTQTWFSKINADLLGYAINLTFKMSGSTPNVIAANGRSYDGSYVGEYFNCNSDVTWVDDTWYHIAFTWDAGGCEIFIDGASRGTDDMPIMGDLIPDRNAIDLTIGSGGDTTQPLTEPFKGAADDVKLYDSVLSASDIYSIYDSAPGLVLYDLTVNNGSGDGSYVFNTTVDITADIPLVDMEFDVWTGDIATVADIYDPATTIAVPKQNVTVTATYKPETLYILTVNGGTGSGSYTQNTVYNIVADAPSVGYVFDVWTGDTAYVTNINDSATTVVMPAAAVTVTATYKPIYALTVSNGTGDGSYAENTIVDIIADAPSAGMEFDVWTGDTTYVTDIDDPTTTVTMPAAAVAVTATYKAATYYTLTVNSGTGDGSYTENEVVDITADAAPGGQMFDVWTGDTAFVTDIDDPTTTVTMPAQATTVTATYKTTPPATVLTIQTDFPGGNALVSNNTGTSVDIAPDLRGDREWFYWCFEATVNQPGAVTFTLPTDVDGVGAPADPAISFQGPAISYDDGVTWDWLGAGSVSGNSFTHTFTADQLTVRLAVTIPYLQSHLEAFLAANASNPHLSASVLTQTDEGRDVELLQIGEPGAGKKAVLFTSRHHATETIATHLLMGFVQEAISESADAIAFRNSHVLYVVPFVDKDGVENGDQGKNRLPHDHNRDYDLGESRLYEEVGAIEALGAAKNIRFLMDWHCPTLRMSSHQIFYFAGYNPTPIFNNQNVTTFGSTIDNQLPSSAPGGPYNWMDEVLNTAICSDYFSIQPGMIMSTTLEVPYAPAGKMMDPASLNSYGADILHAWMDMTFQYSTVPVSAWWEMEETSGAVAYDSLANSYDLTADGGMVISSATTGGKFGNGFFFDGTGNRFTHPTLLDQLSQGITITGWVKPDEVGMSGPQAWFSKQNIGNNQDQLWLRFNMDGGTPAGIEAVLRSHGVARKLQSSLSWGEDDTWYYYAFTWDGNGCNLYVDGALAISDTTPIMRNGTYTDLSIGSGGGVTQPFRGVIDDVHIYDDALTAQDIADLYNWSP